MATVAEADGDPVPPPPVPPVPGPVGAAFPPPPPPPQPNAIAASKTTLTRMVSPPNKSSCAIGCNSAWMSAASIFQRQRSNGGNRPGGGEGPLQVGDGWHMPCP